VSVVKGQASFMHNGISFHTVPLQGKFRFGVSLVSMGHVCEIVTPATTNPIVAQHVPKPPEKIDLGMGALTTMTSLTRQVCCPDNQSSKMANFVFKCISDKWLSSYTSCHSNVCYYGIGGL
jgi:hypothetical protein